MITNEDKEAILKEISLDGSRKIDFAMFGCPHFTLEEVKYIAEKLAGKKLEKENVDPHIQPCKGNGSPYGI